MNALCYLCNSHPDSPTCDDCGLTTSEGGHALNGFVVTVNTETRSDGGNKMITTTRYRDLLPVDVSVCSKCAGSSWRKQRSERIKNALVACPILGVISAGIYMLSRPEPGEYPNGVLELAAVVFFAAFMFWLVRLLGALMTADPTSIWIHRGEKSDSLTSVVGGIATRRGRNAFWDQSKGKASDSLIAPESSRA